MGAVKPKKSHPWSAKANMKTSSSKKGGKKC